MVMSHFVHDPSTPELSRARRHMGRRRGKRAVLLAALALVCVACADESPFASTVPADLRPTLESFRQNALALTARDSAGGVTVAVIDGDKVIWAEGFGWADRAKRVRAGTETIYRIGSLSKTFTAVVLMQLLDRGVIKLDEPVEGYLAEIKDLANPPPGHQPITFRMLASHTAGLIREPGLADAAAGSIAEWESKVIAAIPTVSFDSEPGTKYLYSNIGYGILGLALSRAAHTPFMQLVEEGVFAPLGMTSSTFIIDDRLRPRLSAGYQHMPDGSVDTTTPALEHAGRGYKVPNGGVYSTVGDLARFMAALSGAATPVTSDSLRVMMESPQTPGMGEYGFGIQIKPTGFLGHGGGVSGYTAAFDFDPKTRLGVIVLSNGLAVLGSPLLQQIVQLRAGN